MAVIRLCRRNHPPPPVFETPELKVTPGGLATSLLAALMLVALILATSVAPARAAIDVQTFSDPALTARYAELTERLRCPKCQNESIGASGSPIAADMRKRVATQLRAGASNRAIEDEMVARFGEYVRYDPRFDARTWLLWSLPFMLIVAGAAIVFFFVRRRRHLVNRELDPNERERLAALLRRHDDTAANQEEK